MYFFLSEVCPPDAMFCRDVTKREVSSLFSLVAAWLRRLADQNNSFSAALPPLPQHGPWTGENGKPSRTFSEPFPPHFYLPSSFRFLGDWTAPARASGAPLPACLLLVFTEMLSQSPVFLLLARCLVARALRCAVLCNSALFCSARRESVTGQQWRQPRCFITWNLAICACSRKEPLCLCTNREELLSFSVN